MVAKLDWLGLFSQDLKVPEKVNVRHKFFITSLPSCVQPCVDLQTALDAVCNLWELKMQYEPNEKDMIVMKHTFEVPRAASQ